MSETQATYELGQIVWLDLTTIARSPLNPRKHFDDAALQELADSIAEYGVQQAIQVRPADPSHWRIDPGKKDGRTGFFVYDSRLFGGVRNVKDDPEALFSEDKLGASMLVPAYEVVMGERRFRAARLAGQSHVPAIVRCDMTDALHIEIAIVENVQRKDIDPVEAARAYEQMRGLGYTVEQVAQKIKLAPSTISNAMRLLQLPEAVLTMVSTGELEPTHARNLLKYAQWPEMCLETARYVVANKVPSHEMEKSIPYELRTILDKKKLMKPIERWNANFEINQCNTCQFKAVLDLGNSKYCLNVRHYNELKEQASAAARVEAEKSAARLVELNAKLTSTQQQAITTSGESGAAPAVSLKNLPHNSYRQETNWQPWPEGCTKECPCRAIALNGSGGTTEVCLDPQRCGKLDNAANKAKRERIKELGAGLLTRVRAADRPVQRARQLAVMAWTVLRGMNLESKKAVALALNPAAYPDLIIILSKNGYNVVDADAWEMLRKVPEDTLLMLLTETQLRSELSFMSTNLRESSTVIKFLFPDEEAEDATAPADSPLRKYIDCKECGGLLRLDTMADAKTPIYRCRCGATKLTADLSDACDPSDISPEPATAMDCPECGGAMDCEWDHDADPPGNFFWCEECDTTISANSAVVKSDQPSRDPVTA